MSDLRILMTQGLPASGKSTFAKGMIEQFPDTWVRVNKDDIRAEMIRGQWNKHLEKTIVLPERDRRVAEALVLGKNVIVDDTNFEDEHIRRMYEIAQPFKAHVEVKRFDIDVEEAIKRDSLREKPVGEKVIRDMARRYLGVFWKLEPYVVPEGKPEAIICDLDGTLSLFCQTHGCTCTLNHRSPYNAVTAHRDVLNEPVAAVLRSMTGKDKAYLIFVSGRDDIYRPQTVEFLANNGFSHGQLFMRKGGDTRKDAIIKSEIFDAEIRNNYKVLFVLDDRNQVVDLWRSLGLTCLQVAAGDF